MITIINDKELGKIEIVTQQYQLGLYVAIYKNKRLINQFGSNLKEVAYHRKVRIRAIKRGGIIVDGTILETKSKYPINTFENESSKEVSKNIMGSSLFSIKAELQDIILQLEEGEATDELVAKLGITEDNLKDKIADYLQVIKRYQCDVKECSDEVARVNQIKKTRDNTLRRLKDAVLEAVLMFGSTGKSGNKVIEGSTYKIYSRNTTATVLDDIRISDIIRQFMDIVTEYLASTEIKESLSIEYLARIISAHMKAETSPIEESEDTQSPFVDVTTDDIFAIDTEITINIHLSELANSTNFNLAQWIGQNPHKVEFKSSTSKSAVAANLDLNADLTIAKQVSNTSLIIK